MMKIKKESKDSLAKLSEPWRNIEKGEVVTSRSLPLELKHIQFKLGAYIRLSPTGDEREEGSLVSHPQRIKQFVDSKNLQQNGQWGEVVEWYVDKDLSGKDMNRPNFQKLLKDVRARKINAVIVTELSRLNRKVKDFCEVWELFKENKVALFSLKENFDTSTPMGELMLIQAMSFAQFERQTIVDRIKKGARARAERGLANGYVPLGFKLVDHRPNYREIDETEKLYVEMIFSKYLELKRMSRLLNYLNENGYKTKEFITKSGKAMGGKRWTISSLHQVLTNRAYIGEREVNKRFRTENPENLKDEDRYFFVDAHWPALISKDLFFDVQRSLEENKKKARKYVHNYRLTGLIECAECGDRLVGKSGHGSSHKYFYYGHKRKMVTGNDRHLHRCKIENIPALQLEEAIVSRFKELSRDRDLVAELAKSTASVSLEKKEHQKSLLAAKEQERRKIKQKLDNMHDAIGETDDKTLRGALSRKAIEVQIELEQVEQGIEILRIDYANSCNVVDISDVMELIKIFRTGGFDALDVSDQTEMLKGRIRRIVVHIGKVYVEIYGGENERVLGFGDEKEQKKSPTDLSQDSGINRSGIRTVFKVVGPSGFEPPTSCTPSKRSTKLSHGPSEKLRCKLKNIS